MRVTWIALVCAACGGGTAAPPDAARDAAPDAGPGACRSFARGAPVAFTPRPDGFAPLASVAVPAPVGGDIVDPDAAVRLGKLLFWDTQASSDGQVACASCHYAAGADRRAFDAINPGPDGVYQSAHVTGPGQTAALDNMIGDDRFASEGVRAMQFTALPGDPADAVDQCVAAAAPAPFGGFRQVTPRSTPSIFGAVYLRAVFWDGRATGDFDGVDPFGGTANAAGSASVLVTEDALASQATAPVVNDVEMSCTGRTLDGPAGVGAKLLARAPLAHQVVALDDGALGCMSRAPAPGVQCGGAACTYRDLFAAAFGDALAADGEDHFARLWGQAIAAYEATLVPDQTPFDRYLLGDATALTEPQLQGLRALGDNGCTKCHAGAELSDASATFAAANGLVNVDGGDQGFHDTGVRPSGEDLGRATIGPGGASYSASGAAADQGAFKTAMLRDVGLTAPYFHNGGKASLDDVVEFYSRGGDFPGTASELKPFTFLPGEQKALVDFLTHALTDCRVAMAASPFDHPSLDVVDGPALPAVGAAGAGSCE